MSDGDYGDSSDSGHYNLRGDAEGLDGFTTDLTTLALLNDATSSPQEESGPTPIYDTYIPNAGEEAEAEPAVEPMTQGSGFPSGKSMLLTMVSLAAIAVTGLSLGYIDNQVGWFENDLNNSFIGRLRGKDAASQNVDDAHAGQIPPDGYVQAHLIKEMTVDCYGLHRKNYDLPKWEVTLPRGTFVSVYNAKGQTTIPVHTGAHYASSPVGDVIKDSACGFMVETIYLSPVVTSTESGWVDPVLPKKKVMPATGAFSQENKK